MPRFTVDTFNPSLIPDSVSNPCPGNKNTSFLYAGPLTVGEANALRSAIAREVGAGDTVLAALEDFAEIGWEEDNETLLKTVVWVRDERGRIAGVGRYCVSLSGGYPFLIVNTSGQVFRYVRVQHGDSYQVEMTRYRISPENSEQPTKESS